MSDDFERTDVYNLSSNVPTINYLYEIIAHYRESGISPSQIWPFHEKIHPFDLFPNNKTIVQAFEGFQITLRLFNKHRCRFIPNIIYTNLFTFGQRCCQNSHENLTEDKNKYSTKHFQPIKGNSRPISLFINFVHIKQDVSTCAEWIVRSRRLLSIIFAYS